jgi:hypothetical protein
MQTAQHLPPFVAFSKPLPAKIAGIYPPAPLESARALNYLDSTAKLHKKTAEKAVDIAQKPQRTPLPGCTSGFVSGSCANGHRFAKVITCSKEWCLECGKKDGILHRRRVSRWYDKVMGMENVGYLVVTIPKTHRPHFYNRELLSTFRVALCRFLQRLGYSQGLARWHWVGDCKKCKGDGCPTCHGTGAGVDWHPHLNLLLNFHWMPEKDFKLFTDSIKAFCAKWIAKHTETACKTVVIHLNYCKSEAQRVHKLKYVTRPTLRIPPSKKIQETVYKFRASQTWGKFKIPDQPARDAATMLEKGRCPCCKQPIVWEGFTALKYFLAELGAGARIRYFDTGYLQLPAQVHAPPEKPPPVNRIAFVQE